MATTRTEKDTMGTIEVPADRYWGAQTQRSLEHFRIGGERFPREIIRALGVLKKACAAREPRARPAARGQGAGHRGRRRRGDRRASSTTTSRSSVWQTGSGTQTNMNANEVIANRAIELARRRARLAAAGAPQRRRQPRASPPTTPFPPRCTSPRWSRSRGALVPAVTRAARHARAPRREAFADIVKIGRTHLQDATPLTLGQEISGWVAQLDHGLGADPGRAARALRAGPRRHRGRHRAQRAPASSASVAAPRSPS